MSPLLYASRDGRLDSVKILVDAKADVNQAEANSISPLVIALNNNQIAVAKYLIDHRADLNAADWYGRTPVWLAVELRDMDVTNSTFAHDVDRDGALEVLTTLLDRGANPTREQRKCPLCVDTFFLPPRRCRGSTSPVRRLSLLPHCQET